MALTPYQNTLAVLGRIEKNLSATDLINHITKN